MNSKLLKLYFSREQKADVVDCLLQIDALSGFSLYEIDGFSRRHERYDIAEQIRGARRMLAAEVVCNEHDLTEIRAALQRLNVKEPIRFTLHPIEAMGHLI